MSRWSLLIAPNGHEIENKQPIMMKRSVVVELKHVHAALNILSFEEKITVHHHFEFREILTETIARCVNKKRRNCRRRCCRRRRRCRRCRRRCRRRSFLAPSSSQQWSVVVVVVVVVVAVVVVVVVHF